MCKNEGATVGVSAQDTSAINQDTIAIDNMETVSPEKHAFAEFAASRDDVVVRVRDRSEDLEMEQIGTLKDTTIRVLGEGADTHIGSSVHTYNYDGISLEFFGPRNGNGNWLQKVDITGSDWSTARGIHVGDPVSDLKTLYPKASNETTGNPNLYRYEMNESQIEFITANDKVSRIVIQYNIP
jgi:hypothetical protein